MLFRSIPLGVYYPGNSLIHRLQSRTKLLIIAWLIIWQILASHREWHFVPFGVLVVLVGASLACARISAVRDMASCLANLHPVCSRYWSNVANDRS